MQTSAENQPPKNTIKEEEYSIPMKKSKPGRPKKTIAFSSYRCYEERDIEFFIHQISDNQLIWDRRNSLKYDGNLIHATFHKIEVCCQFLSRKNGENASRLWTELSSEYKREKMRLENLPSGIYSEEFEVRFPFMQQMWFLEIEGAEMKEADSNSREEPIVNLARQKSNNSDAPDPSATLAGSIENLNSSINRLISVIGSKPLEDTNACQTPSKYSDIIEYVIGFLDKTPREKQMEVKCKIYNFLDSLS